MIFERGYNAYGVTEVIRKINVFCSFKSSAASRVSIISYDEAVLEL